MNYFKNWVVYTRTLSIPTDANLECCDEVRQEHKWLYPNYRNGTTGNENVKAKSLLIIYMRYFMLSFCSSTLCSLFLVDPLGSLKSKRFSIPVSCPKFMLLLTVKLVYWFVLLLFFLSLPLPGKDEREWGGED